MRSIRAVPSVVLILSLGGCGESPTAPNTESPIQTDQTTYELAVTAHGFQVDIPHDFENRTGSVVYIVNCDGSFPIVLDQLVDDTWKPRWATAVDDCLSPPLAVQQGGTMNQTLEVFAGFPGSNSFPQFTDGEIDGTYRLRWLQVLSSYDEDIHPFGPEIHEEFRVSNSFTLIVGG